MTAARDRLEWDSPRVVAATDYVRKWGSLSRPVALRCDDDRTYVVKSLRTDRDDMANALVVERVASVLGRLLQCPIPEPVFVDVPEALIAMQGEMQHMRPGVGHAVELMPECGDKEGVGEPRNDQNRSAYPALAVLYGWFHCPGDHQLIRSTRSLDVYSVDHGLFLPTTPGRSFWSAASLPVAGEPQPDSRFSRHCRDAEILEAIGRLALISEADIADAIAAIPPEWGASDGDLFALGTYLAQRRVTMVNSTRKAPTS